jgi:hypothetical protein
MLYVLCNGLLDIRTYAMISQRSQQPAAAAASSQQHRHLSTYRATLISLGEIDRRIEKVKHPLAPDPLNPPTAQMM